MRKDKYSSYNANAEEEKHDKHFDPRIIKKWWWMLVGGRCVIGEEY